FWFQPYYFFSVALAAASSRSRAMVLTRAMSRRRPRIFFRLSVCPILSWNFNLKSWSLSSRSCETSSSTVKFRTFSDFIAVQLSTSEFFCPEFLVCAFALHKHGPQRQLVRSQTHGFAGILLRDPFHLEQDLARPHHRDPMIGRTLSLTHTGFSRLLGNRLVREKTDLYLAATLDEPGHGHACRLDLTVGDPARFKHLQAEISESQLASAPGFSGHTPALLLAVLHFLWHQHRNLLLASNFWLNP